eukprot:TCALIF_13259-PA protein Name:"Similar to Nelf-E Negative elongation factor E (Drosophila melanogaster)" AED:0.16 eAED:0.16 QI:0/0.8/0.66/1/1/1/6/83/326
MVLTDEELMLKAKYEKLRRIKKKVALSKLPHHHHDDKLKGGHDHKPALLLSGAGSTAALAGSGGTSSGPGLGVSGASLGGAGAGLGGSHHRIPEAKDAKEVAKKLIRTGALQTIQKTIEKDKQEKSRGFKRSQGLERKLTGLDARAGYQPFSATHGPSGGFDTGGEDMNPEPVEPPPKKVKNLYDTFVTARDREERGLPDREGNQSEKPRQGHTVYVFGYNISEDFLKTVFASNGKIVNVSLEVEKNCGFVTFEKPESAEAAISEHNDTLAQGIQLKVSMARRQPQIDPINDASSSSTWSTIAASHSQKGSHKDKRDLVTYDDGIF